MGSSSHLAIKLIASNQRYEKLHAPFTSQAPGMQAVAAGQVAAMVLPVGGAASPARDARARIPGIAVSTRRALVPGVPTLTELGVPLSTGLWLALYAPRGTPAPVVARLNEAFREGSRNEQLLAAFRHQATVPSAPAGLAGLARTERRQWASVIRERNIVVE